jgi:hypothetical protein
LGIAQQLGHTRTEVLHGARPADVTSLAIAQVFSRSTRIGDDNRQSARLRLEHHIAGSICFAWKHEYIAGRHGGCHVVVRQAASEDCVRTAFLQLCGHGTVAYDDETIADSESIQQGLEMLEQVEPLLPGEATGIDQRRPSSAHAPAFAE